jgi:glucosylceramidase
MLARSFRSVRHRLLPVVAGLVLCLPSGLGCGGGSSGPSGSAGTTGVAGTGQAGNGTGGGASGSAGTTGAAGAGGSSAGGGAGSTGVAGSGSAGSSGVAGSGNAGSGGTTGAAGQSGRGGAAGTGVAGAAGGRGGAAAGGAGGNAGSGVGGQAGATAPPAFVTSAANAYWNTQATAMVVTGGTADLIVDENTKYQRWEGFGGTFNEMGWDALGVVGATETTKALKLLFDARDGANFVFGRLPVGASDYATSWYTLAETANDYTMEHFTIARDREKLIPYIKAAMQVRSDIHLWASPWIVPSWMKDSGGNMKGDAQTQGAFALYLAKFVEEYGKEGLKIEAIHPQNEPGYAQVHWTQTLFIDFFKTYLGPTFAQRNVPAEIWCGTMSHPTDGTWATALASDPAALMYVKGFGLQWNLQTTVAMLAPKGRVWQTEHKCGNYNFSAPYWDQSRYDPNKAQNDHLYGEESWQLIRDWIVAGVNAYNAWNMVLDTVGKSLGNWPQNALLVVDRSAKKLIATPAYYTFRHFSQYIAPGATRIKISGSTDALAFKNPDGSIITEVYNSGSAAKTTTVGIGSVSYRFDVPAHGWATLRTTQ